MPLKINPDISPTIWRITRDPFFPSFFFFSFPPLVLLNLICIFQHFGKCRAFENFPIRIVYSYMSSPIYFPLNYSKDWCLKEWGWSKWHVLQCPGASASYYCLNLCLDCIYCSLLSHREPVLKSECCSSNNHRAARFIISSYAEKKSLEIESNHFHKALKV